MLKYLARSGLALAVAAPLSLAWACGEWPAKHGGEMNYNGGELTFELVGNGRDAVLYLEDHGKPVMTGTAEGRVQIRSGERAWSGALQPAGDNRMALHLPEPLKKDDAIVADVQFADGTVAKGRFVLGRSKVPQAQLGASKGFAAFRLP